MAPAAAASGEMVAAEEGPAWVELEPSCSEQQLDRALAEAQQLDIDGYGEFRGHVAPTTRSAGGARVRCGRGS